jgi:hypothetical protein
MSYFVTCTFDLKNGSSQDYQNAYADLEKIGLKKVVVHSDGRRIVAPTTLVAGIFNGTRASSVCSDIRDNVKNAFSARGFSSEIFVVVGGDWAWVDATT